MTIVKFNDYETEKINFLVKNGGLDKTDISDMNEYNCYMKYYICGNGKMWYESIQTYYYMEKYDNETGLTLSTYTTKIEFWNDENATSKIYYDGSYNKK